MNEYHFDVEITRTGRRVSGAHDEDDRQLLQSAATLLSERTYRTKEGVVRVRIEWPQWRDEPSLRTTLQVIDDSGRLDPRDAASYVELFFHDIFLIFNLAVPGSFGGVIAPSGAQRVNEIALDARLFEYALGFTERAADVTILPLRDVVAWYDSLDLGTRQVATYGVAKVLFQLLALSRGEEQVAWSVLALAQSLELLGVKDADPAIFELRDAVVRGTAPVLHPLHDDVLDAQSEDVLAEWLAAADRAAGAVIAALQARIRAR